ncbi:hypothetical protein PanWU01x14_138830 [Parasponia andersonii]|uniref:Rapid ALkalinization Factor n=1 Tax=Parasponia andersonii TaxID=3476 RepID=A0A2P5CMS6_PARAD|nr:hypothetical protein PanWU01x14_138830 [Parasponia andersonii]
MAISVSNAKILGLMISLLVCVHLIGGSKATFFDDGDGDFGGIPGCSLSTPLECIPSPTTYERGCDPEGHCRGDTGEEAEGGDKQSSKDEPLNKGIPVPKYIVGNNN